MQTSEPKKTLRITLTKDEHQKLIEEIRLQHCSQQNFIKQKLLDDPLGAKQLSDRIMQMMPKFYNLAAEVSDSTLRRELEAFGGAVCRCLK